MGSESGVRGGAGGMPICERADRLQQLPMEI